MEVLTKTSVDSTKLIEYDRQELDHLFHIRGKSKSINGMEVTDRDRVAFLSLISKLGRITESHTTVTTELFHEFGCATDQVSMYSDGESDEFQDALETLSEDGDANEF